METDLEILQRQFDDLNEELSSLDQKAAKAMAGIGGKGETKIDLFRWRQRKNKLRLEIPIIESKLLQAHIKKLVSEREEAKAELERLRPELVAASEDYDAKLKALEESFIRHGQLQSRAFLLDQTIQITWDDLQSKKVELRSLIKSVTGVDEEQETNTENLLIRN